MNHKSGLTVLIDRDPTNIDLASEMKGLTPEQDVVTPRTRQDYRLMRMKSAQGVPYVSKQRLQ